MNINEVSLIEYNNMSLEEKINFYSKIKSNMKFIPAKRERFTKNVPQKEEKQSGGRLTFIEELRRTDTQCTNFYYLCICDCGNWFITVNSNYLKNISESCGCKRKERGAEMCKKILGPNNALDLTGKIFGDLEVLEKTDKRIGKYNVVWKCRCINCGTEQEVQASMLNRGIRMFCEKCSQRKSRGEKIISTLLDINNIIYQKEYSFNNCRFLDTNRPAQFDFYVNNQYLIEFDGEQHFEPQTFNNISKEKAKKNFIKSQKHDEFKNKWCKDNNIPLIRIPYTHLNKICLEDLLLETSQFVIN